MKRDQLQELKILIEAYMNEKTVVNFSKNSLQTYFRVLNNFYEFYTEYYDTIKIAKIDRALMLKYINLLKTSTATKTLNILVLNNFFKYVHENYFPKSELNIILKGLIPKKEKRKTVALNTMEYQRALQHLMQDNQNKRDSFFFHRNRLLFKILLLTGVRVSELIKIKTTDFETAWTGSEKLVYKILVYGKGNKERFVYIEQKHILEDFLFMENYLKELSGDSQYISVTKKGRLLIRSEIFLMAKRFLYNCGINKQGVHIFRHSFGKNLVSKNINLSTIKELLGHSNIQTTMIYAQTNEKAMIDAICDLEGK